MKGLVRKYFLNNLALLFSTREKVFNSFKIRLFPTREPATEPDVATEPKKTKKATKVKTKHKKSSLKLSENFSNKIENEEKNINEQIFRDSFLYQTLSYLIKVLYDSDEIKNYEIIKNINNGLLN